MRDKSFSSRHLLLHGRSGAGSFTTPYIAEDSTGSTFNRGDFTATGAFFWSSLNLSTYHGTDTGYTPFYIEVLDGVGKKATGYIGAVGAGEILGNELVTDPTFDVDGDWTKGTGWTVVGGKAVALTSPYLERIYETLAFTVGQLLKGVIICDSFTTGQYRPQLGGNILGTYTNSGTKIDYTNILYTGSWGNGIRAEDTLSATFTDISTKRVTSPPSTAVHIVSSLNGITRNWASIESGFDPNAIASWNIYG